MSVRSAIGKVLPRRLLAAHTARVVERTRREFAARSLRESFEAVYERHLWGEEGSPFSGSGSNHEFAEAYRALVLEVIQQAGADSIADLGCGDFSVGDLIARSGIKYIGVDIVPNLVDRNTRLYGRDNVSFLCRDLSAEDPPPADLALLRQVLQHLSNEEIGRVLGRCSIYERILVTEHIPQGTSWLANLDKPHGPDIRLHDGSGVLLEAPPFLIPVVELHRLPWRQPPGGVLRTVEVRGADLTPRQICAR